MSTGPIDFSDLGAKQVSPAPRSVDFSDLGAKQVTDQSVLSKIWAWGNALPGRLQARAGELQQEAQRQVNMAEGPESAGRGLLNRFGHRVASLVPETAAMVDQAAAGMLDPKNSLALAAGAVDPAIPAAYFGTQAIGALTGANGQPSSVKAAVQNPSPENVQNVLAQASMATGAGAGAAAPRSGTAARAVVKAFPAAVDAVNPRGVLAGKMAEIPPGQQFSRGEVLDAARAHDVNLDVAQATDSTVAKAVKKANEYSLTSQGAYEANKTQNLDSLGRWANNEASKYSPEAADREVVGGQVQEALKAHLEARKNVAKAAFTQLDNTVGGNVLDVSGSVAAEARKIISDNADYYAKHPELKPSKAWSILEDLAKQPQGKPVPKSVGGMDVLDAGGRPAMGKAQPGGPKIASWTELHQLRSDLMDFYRNNPDVVKGRSDAWIQQMVGKIDETMTHASAGLSLEDLSKFRNANAVWEGIKNTYDNPQSQYYHAVRAQYPSQVPGMLSKGSPELARSVRETLGSLEGPFQRQFVENLINDKNGNLDLGRLNQRLKGASNDHLEAMIGPEGARNLKLLGKVSQKVLADANPSGSGKVVQAARESSGMITGFGGGLLTGHPGVAAVAAGYPALQWIGGKAMNSPKVVDYLTGR